MRAKIQPKWTPPKNTQLHSCSKSPSSVVLLDLPAATLHSDDLPRIDFYIMINKISNYYLTCVCVLKIRFQTITSYVCVLKK